MAQIQPFRGLRYDLKHVGSLSQVIAPPYDVIGPELQEQLYKAHPANVVRLILNREEPGDDAGNNRYSRAAKFLNNWQSEGVLIPPSRSRRSTSITRYSSTAAASLPAKASWPDAGWSGSARGASIRTKRRSRDRRPDRLLLTRGLQEANLSQIFGLYPDPAEPCQQSCCWIRPSPGKRRSKRPTISASSIGCGP